MKNIENDFLQKIVIPDMGFDKFFSYKNNICNALTKSIEKNMGWQQLYKDIVIVEFADDCHTGWDLTSFFF